MEKRTIAFSELNNLEGQLKPGDVITEIPDLGSLREVVRRLQEEIADKKFATNPDEQARLRDNNAVNLHPIDRLVRNSLPRGFHGIVENLQVKIIPPDSSIIRNPENIDPDSLRGLRVSAELVSNGRPAGQAAIKVVLYARNRRNGPQKEPSWQIMQSSQKEPGSGKEWEEMRRKAIQEANRIKRAGLLHPESFEELVLLELKDRE